MLVVGLGLGLVMQVLVLAAQNAVEYRYLGVATSASTLFRQVGGSVGLAAFGSVFASRLGEELSRRLPRGIRLPAASTPEVVGHLPAAVHQPYVAAFAASLRPVFLLSAAVASAAFLLTWLLREIPLRRISFAEMAADDAAAGAPGQGPSGDRAAPRTRGRSRRSARPSDRGPARERARDARAAG
jgi:hypothetical protein